MKNNINIFLTLFILPFLFSCNDRENGMPNTLSESEKEKGWELLFDGKSFDNWHIYNRDNVPSAWVIENGVIYCDPNSDGRKGDLVTDREFENFELVFDWKLDKECNSGVFINVQERPDIDATYYSGPEYQLLEDSHVDYDKPLKRSGCLYEFFPQKNFVKTKGKGQWNHSRIVQNNGKAEFYLNGTLTAQVDFNSPTWKKLITRSVFKNHPEFGKHTKGKIALQDWSRGAYFQNIKIREL